MPASVQDQGALICWLTPARAARGPMRLLTVPQSFAIHLLGLLGFLIGLVILTDLELDDLFDIPPQGVGLFLLGVLTLLVFIEGVYVWAALLTVCWGAGAEPYVKSFSRTLARWYQLTPWHVVLTLGLIAAIVWIDDLDHVYYDNYGKPGTRQMLERERFRFVLDALRLTCFTAYYSVGLWWTLSCLAVHRDTPAWYASCRWPAGCEGCGYALLGLDSDHACPECGMPVRDSKHTRRGVIQGGFWSITRNAVFSPARLGEQMLTRQPTRKHTKVLMYALLLTIACGPVGVLLVRISEQLMNGWYQPLNAMDWIRTYIFVGIMVGVALACIGTFVLLGIGSLGATLARVFGKRNAMPAYCQACTLSAGALPAWVLTNFLLFVVFAFFDRVLDETGLYSLLQLIPIAWLGINMLIGFLYLLLVTQIARAARFANT